MQRYIKYVEKLIELSEKEIARTCNLVSMFKAIKEFGRLEIICSAVISSN